MCPRLPRASTSTVSKERLRLQVDKDALLVEGDIPFPMPEGMAALYAEVRATRYSRILPLSGEPGIDSS